jgi:hypothetical protein
MNLTAEINAIENVVPQNASYWTSFLTAFSSSWLWK